MMMMTTTTTAMATATETPKRQKETERQKKYCCSLYRLCFSSLFFLIFIISLSVKQQKNIGRQSEIAARDAQASN